MAAFFALLLSSLSWAQTFYVGSEVCAGCHQDQYEDWQSSHHWHAMAEASADSVLGDFNDSSFEYFGLTSSFRRDDERFFVRTDNAQGELEEFEILYTFGFYPLQQYLIGFPDGRLQVLNISWDSRPPEEGGQRWFHLFPDDPVDHEDALHWTGSYFNWNSRCASCHSTDLQKNYSLESNTYNTQWHEINVGCEACHGPASDHLNWARGDSMIADRGLLNDLSAVQRPEGGRWPYSEAQVPEQRSEQLLVCAACHSRRTQLVHADISGSFADMFSPSLLTEGLYHADGQIEDEVFEYGSFLQSEMHMHQVSCTNCHEPHSNRLVAEGNALCLQCHEPAVYQAESHFFHEPGSEGAQCVSCHMPATVYMGVDARRDHSFRIPDPVASLELGIPNACTQCHTDEDDAWAADLMTARTGRTEPYYDHANIFYRARQNDESVAGDLLVMARDGRRPAILRATALVESSRFPAQRNLGVILGALQDADPLIRSSAVSALDFLPVSNRYQYLQPLVTDPVKSVRMAVARQLAALPANQIPAVYRAQSIALFQEYEESMLHNADIPEVMSDLGVYYFSRGELENAEAAMLQAIELAPAYLPALLNLADLYREMQRELEGEELLSTALELYPESADAHHALGLLRVRTGRLPQSLSNLQQAMELAPGSAQYALAYSLALGGLERYQEAISVLEAAVRRFPGNNELMQVLIDYRARL